MIERSALLLFASTLLVTVACGDGDPEPLAVPNTGTAWVVYGTAQSGRAVVPSTVVVKRASDVLSISPDPIGGGDVDMFFAGLDEDDLPDGLDPSALVFVSESNDRAHRLPTFHEAFVFERPRPHDAPAPLVPVDSGAASTTTPRQKRLDTMLRGLAIKDPCVEPASALNVIAPRTQGEDIPAMRTLSNGDTWVAFTATGTVIAGVIEAGAVDLSDVVGIGTGTAAVERAEKVRISDLGDQEVIDRTGRISPSPYALNFLGAFGGIGQIVRFDPNRGYVDDTPVPSDGTPAGLFRGARRLMLSGKPQLCVYGTVLGPNANAGIFCREDGSQTWITSGVFGGALAIIEIIEPGIAFDVAGTIYVHNDNNARWEPTLRPAINEGCATPCAAFDVIAPGRSDSGPIAVLAGSRAQTLVLDRAGGDQLEARPIEAMTGALFADERRDGANALVITAATIAPDGAVWLAGTESVLFRAAPDRSSVERICLPKEARDTVITALEAHPDGRLIVGMSPPLFGFGRW